MNGAFAHLLTNASYLAGLLVLHQSHLEVGSQYPFVVMVTPFVRQEVRDILTDVGIIVREVEPLTPSIKVDLDTCDVRFSDTWTKLRSVSNFNFLSPLPLATLLKRLLIVDRAFELYEYEVSRGHSGAS